MNIIDLFKIKNNFGGKSNNSSLRLGRNKKFYNDKNLFKKEIYKSPFSKNFLPHINKFNSLNVTKKFSDYNKSVLQRININSYTLKTNKKFNIIPLRNSLSFEKKKERPKLDILSNRDKITIEYFSNKNNIDSINETNKIETRLKETKNSNKMKDLKKVINVYFSKNADEKKNKKNEDYIKDILNREENQTIKSKINKKNSMFVTEMNFLINNKNKYKNELKEIKKSKKLDYDSLSFKELLKHIENDKKKIINNQNDIDDMLKTAKDTHYEIWKCNNHHYV